MKEMFNKEKVKSFLKNSEFKFWTIAVLLLTIVGFQADLYLKTRKMRKFVHKKFDVFANNKEERAELEKFRRRFDDDFSKVEHLEHRKVGTAEGVRKNFDKNTDKANRQKVQRDGAFVFRPRAAYKEEEKNFTVTFKTPKNLKLEDIKVKFDNSVLTINIEENKSTDNGFYYESFTQTYTTPVTKATINDVKTTLENNRFVVIVPII
jgi:HSP20 family molecular chaperone IbpA